MVYKNDKKSAHRSIAFLKYDFEMSVNVFYQWLKYIPSVDKHSAGTVLGN